MRGFWRRRRLNRDKRPTAFWQACREGVEGFQRRLAAYLERRTAYWDRRSKFLVLVLFCLLFGGLSLWLLVRAFSHF